MLTFCICLGFPVVVWDADCVARDVGVGAVVEDVPPHAAKMRDNRERTKMPKWNRFINPFPLLEAKRLRVSTV